MGLVSEIKKKSRQVKAPELEISKDDNDKLQRGEVVIINDKKTGQPYLIRVKIDKIGIGPLSQNDIEIEKVYIPAARH